MTEEQKIPLGDATHATLDASGIDVDIQWNDSIDQIAYTGSELTVERAADELFLRAERPGGRRSRRDASPSDRLVLVLPKAVTVSKFEIEDGDVSLDSPTGQVECAVKSGSMRSNGGNAELSAVVGSGDLHITDQAGSIEAIGGSGDMEIVDCRAVIGVKAGSGDVTLTRVDAGAIKVTAGSGDIEITDCVAEAFSAEAGSGSVTLSAGQLARTSVRTGSGDVSCATQFGAHGQSVMTGSGSVSFGMPQGLPARVEATTSRGSIDSQLPLVSVGQRGPRSRRTRRQVGSIGEGEPRAEISIRTGSGDIRLYWLNVPPAGPRPSRRSTSTAETESPVETRETGDEGPSGITSTTAMEILEALSRGEITVEEADALLSKIDRPKAD